MISFLSKSKFYLTALLIALSLSLNTYAKTKEPAAAVKPPEKTVTAPAGETATSATPEITVEKEISVEWFYPSLKPIKKPKQIKASTMPPPSPTPAPSAAEIEETERAIVIVSGKTEPGYTIEISGEKIPYFTSTNDVGYLQKNEVSDSSTTIADTGGFFDLTFKLPFKAVQLSFKITTPSGQSKLYQLNINVTKAEVSLDGMADLKLSPFIKKKWELWAGTGYNYLVYEQQSPQLNSSLTLNTFKGPSYYLKGAWNINKDWSSHLTFNASPGDVSGSNNITVSDGNYYWTFLALQAIYFPRKMKPVVHGWTTEIGFPMGVQFHHVPFISRSSTTNDKTAEVDSNSLTMLAAGIQWNIYMSKKWSFESFMRYQYPISSGRTFDISPKYAFDGSLGAAYRWKPKWRMGGYWYGQMHQYDYSNHTDTYFAANSPGSNPISGSQSLFFTNFEFRIGYDFD